MQSTPTTPNAGVEERRNRVGQDRPSGKANKGISEEYIAQAGKGLEPSIDGKRPTEAEEDFVGFFRLLLEIDTRINPELYDKSIRNTKRHGDEGRHDT